MTQPIRVTVEDLENGDQESQDIIDDYIIVTAGSYYVSGVVQHKNGTHVVTIKRDPGWRDNGES